MLRRTSNWKGKVLTTGWAVIILILSSLPSIPGESTVPFFHQIGHFMEFAVLTPLLLLFTFVDKKLKAVAVAFTFGIVVEIYQYFLPWRYFGLWDPAINLMGAVFGISVCEIVLNKANVINY